MWIYKSEEEGVGVEKMEKRKIIPFSFFFHPAILGI